MLNDDNLTELLRLLNNNSDNEYYHIQNDDHVKKSELVSEIVTVNNQKIIKTNLSNPSITLVRIRGVVNKVFGDLFYE